MNYLYSVLVKVVIFIVLSEATFSIWKTEDPGLMFWILPIVSLMWFVLTVVEVLKINKAKKWLQDKNIDERETMYKYKAGYTTFWANIVFLTVIFFYYGNFGSLMLNPYDTLASVILLNTVVYFGMKLYYLFYK